jgi:hypothetical protein
MDLVHQLTHSNLRRDAALFFLAFSFGLID